MKRIFKKLSGLFLLFLMLFSIAFFGLENSDQVSVEDPIASAYVFEKENDSKYINDLVSSTDYFESRYNLADYYPMINENQADTPFCWIYSSMKSLESSLMVQKNEYYNFSEIGLAYLYYLDRVETLGKNSAFLSDGNFEKFAQCYQDYGLILESDFSNDSGDDIDKNSYEYYRYATEKTSKEFNSIVKPYLIGSHSAFSSLTEYEAKRVVIKRFIKTYGAVFTGIQGHDPMYNPNVGCTYNEDIRNPQVNDAGVITFYAYDRASHKNDNGYKDLPANHAVTLIGWNDDIEYGVNQKGAFLAMNSWGFESNSLHLFYIPYTYTYALSETRGFICDGDGEKISIESASDSNFTTDILKGNKEINNFFCYDDDIWVNYKLNVSSLENIDVEISTENKNFNGLFSVTSDSANKCVKVSLNNTADFYGGYYTISFYDNGTLLGKRGIYIYSGTEINYLKVMGSEILDVDGTPKQVAVLDKFALDNAFLNSNNILTVNSASSHDVGGAASVLFFFNRSPINSQVAISKSNKTYKLLELDVYDVEIISSNNKSLETKYTQKELIEGLFSYSVYDLRNEFSLQVGNRDGSGLALTEFENSLIRFKLKMNSSVYENCEREYVCNIFVSSRYSAKTSDLYSVFYDLDGGMNNPENVTKVPRYSPEETGNVNIFDEDMTAVPLLKPEKLGYVFVGWYKDEARTQLVTQLDNTLPQGNIKLYAKWESEGVDFFDMSLELYKAFAYAPAGQTRQEKSLDSLVYGDSIQIKFNFVKKNALETYPYTISYRFYGTETISDYLLGNSVIFTLPFPDLGSGDHVFTIRIKLIISNAWEIVDEARINVSVQKKNVVFDLRDGETTYNGLTQKPEVFMTEDFYAEDYEGVDRNSLFTLTCGTDSKNANTYNFYITQLNNKNYTFDKNSETSKCVFVIKKKPISLKWNEDYYHVYDGTNCFPEYEFLEGSIIEGDVVKFSFTVPECKNAGTYTINILPQSITNLNYSVNDELPDFTFTIHPAKIKVIIHNTTDRVQTLTFRRKVPTYTVIGMNELMLADDLKINVFTDAKEASKSGVYEISCAVNNSNYVCDVQNGYYTLTGYYNVYYQLANGKAYTERVEENDKPVGVTKKQLGLPVFSKISYSDDYVVTGNDIYVSVSYENYSAFAYSVIITVIAAIVAFVVYLKKRGSNVR